MDHDLQQLERKKKRIHGCQFPWSIQFIFSWIFIVFSGIFYYIIYDPFFSLLEVRVTLTLVTSFLWIFLIVTGILLIFSDPSDVRIFIQNLYKIKSTDIEGTSNFSSENTLQDARLEECKYCLVCKVHVHNESLHCKYCNKCVYRLDHHCFYVNNCIGKSNYSLYILSMILATLFSLWNSCISLYAFSIYFLDQNFFSRIKLQYNIQSNEVIISIIVLFTIVSSIVWIYLMWLLHFHYILSRHGMTSLEYTRSKKISATLE
jgi:hypothetical protein